MSSPDVDALQARLTAMERKVRIMSVTWVATAIAAAVLGLGAQQVASQTQTLSARTIHIVDQGGRTRISLGFSTRGNPAIWFYDETGKNRIHLGLATGKGLPTPQLLLADENETDRLFMGWSDTVPEQPLMFVHDESGRELWHAP